MRRCGGVRRFVEVCFVSYDVGLFSSRLQETKRARKAAREGQEREEFSTTAPPSYPTKKRKIKLIRVHDFCEKNEGWSVLSL